ncbi:TetR family transcriptional regulator [Nocardia puris]|uniref:TetR family transcriptional regulator n=1 Tax=Nocardia puris TaxID=208602 RepID=A0A366CYV1_9NOCA|nr:TetR family transcriptional regulator [Nocardia puris]RBO82399.1 TetR family transcriptional regulator [Nocardia puris]
MPRTPDGGAEDRIIGVVLDLLETDGYDAVQLREVARRAQVSLTTVYRTFPTREDLILAAVEHWMAANAYGDIPSPPPGESLRDGLVRMVRYIFVPWDRNPRMCAAYVRARSGRNGERLDRQGVEAILPTASELFAGVDPDYAADIAFALSNLTYGLLNRIADGSLEVGEILPALERFIDRLTGDNVPYTHRSGGPDAQTFTIGEALLGPYVPRSNRD